METTLLSESAWAQMEFGSIFLGDERRDRRLVQIAANLAHCPSGTLPTALPHWDQLKAAYRLLSNEEVSYEAIMTPHWKKTRRACELPGEYLLIEDTTVLDFSAHPAVKGLGRIGDDRGLGLNLHTTLAARVERWDSQEAPQVKLVGLFGQKCWVRQDEPKKGKESRRARLKRERESQRWAQVFEGNACPKPDQAQWIYTADREADIYESFVNCRRAGIDFDIRATQPRKVETGNGSLFDAVAQAPLKGSYQLKLRAREGVSARSAVVEVRAVAVRLCAPWRPDGQHDAFPANVVEVREVGAPDGVTPIHWVLLTSLPIETYEQIRRVVNLYAKRWLVEEYHKALKTGMGIEKSQLETVGRIKALLGISAVVAVRLLNTKLLSSTTPDAVVGAEEIGDDAKRIIENKFGVPEGGWTYGTMLRAIARLGGFLARKGDGNPGWLTIWRGWHRLLDMTEGYNLANGIEDKKCG